jgi:hypothetical protein
VGGVTGRRELLEAYGRFYGSRNFAIAWTNTNRPDRGDPKKVTTPGWQFTPPLANEEVGATVFGRGITANPVINLRTSGLVGIECDGAEELAKVKALGLPATLTERSSGPAKLHFYFTAPPELETVPKVSFRFEAGKLTAATNNYYVCAPAIHETGAIYTHLPAPGPSEVELAAMPVEIYRQLLRQAGAERAARRRNGGPVETGGRHEHLREISYAMRRYSGASLEAITAALLVENGTYCKPPKEERLVRALAEYTYGHITPLRDDR